MGASPKVTSFITRLEGRETVAERTLAFRLARPAGFTFKPGQYIDVTLLSPPETDAEGNTRSFSIASSPGEQAVRVATRLRDTAFKRILAALPLGQELKIEGPFGNLTLHNNTARAAVLIAGGIGITPFLGMVHHAAEENLAHTIFLFYSNRRPEDASFLTELHLLERKNPKYKFIGIMTGMEKSRSRWDGETGHITADILGKHLAGAASPIFYIAGPPGMVTGVQQLLHEMRVDDDDIRTEEFAGY